MRDQKGSVDVDSVIPVVNLAALLATLLLTLINVFLVATLLLDGQEQLHSALTAGDARAAQRSEVLLLRLADLERRVAPLTTPKDLQNE
jgi:hypothetical protein